MPLNLQVHPMLEDAEPMVRAFFQDTLLDLAVVVQLNRSTPLGTKPFGQKATTEPFKIILVAGEVSAVPGLIQKAVKTVQSRWLGWSSSGSSWLIQDPNSGLNPKVIDALSVKGAAARILLSGHGHLWDTDNYITTPINRESGLRIPPLMRYQLDPNYTDPYIWPPPVDPSIFRGNAGMTLLPEVPMTEKTYQVLREDIAKNKAAILRYQHQIMTVVVDKLSDPEFMEGFEIREEV